MKDHSCLRAKYRHYYQRKIRLYRELASFTFRQCGDCAQSGCACTDRICQHVEEQASKKGLRFERGQGPLRFIGSHGCLVPPHLRETCTIYLCEKAQSRPEFDRDRYQRLRNLCALVDWKLMELEEILAQEDRPIDPSS